MIEQFSNQYSISKTLRFSLKPIGMTEEFFNSKLLLETDKQRAEDYASVKKIIDRYHKSYIDSVLSSINYIEGLSEYAELYGKSGKNEKELKRMETLEASMRKYIAGKLTSNPRYKDISSPKVMIEQLLPEFVEGDELVAVSHFHNFSTYFSGFFTNRKNMYSDEEKSTAVSYRCINDNLPKFLDNCKSFEKIYDTLPESTLNDLARLSLETFGIRIEDAFSVDYFPFVLSQSGIDRYNGIIGGYTCSDTTKVQGLNEVINLFNQKLPKEEKSKKLPKIKPLYKQILSDRETVSFLPEKFENDDEVIACVNEFYNDTMKNAMPLFIRLFDGFDTYNPKGIFVTAGLAITDLSNAVFGDWNAFSSAWYDEYQNNNPIKKGKSIEKYDETMKKAY